MDSDKVEGKAKEMEGKLTDDKSREAEGKLQGGIGDAKEKGEDAKNWAEEKGDEARERL